MDLDVVRAKAPLARLVYWMQERERIRLAREAGATPPWTDDPILAQYRFCNVRRMDDRVSRWLWEKWYAPHRTHPNLLVAVALARHFNLPSALEELGFPLKWDAEHVKKVMRERKRRGDKIFNGAYMIRGIGTADKTEMVVDKVCTPLVERPPPIDTSSMENSVNALLPYWGFSSFMAGQVVADLRWALAGSWADKYHWAPYGPGSVRGINRVKDRPLTSPVSQPQFLVELAEVMTYCKKVLHPRLTQRLEAMDYQNCLCEVDKYSRALEGTGKPKQLYRSGSL